MLCGMLYKIYYTYPMKTDDIYLKYTAALKNLENDPSIFSTFKSNTYFNDILEHTDFTFGERYQDLIRSEFNEEPKNFIEVIKRNDSIGGPVKYAFGDITMSPSNLRYIYHALLIKSKCLRWFPNKKNIRILEIGGGYGGLCLYLKSIYKECDIDYTIIDLPEPSNLQNKFLKEVGVQNARSISCKKIDDLSNEKFDLVISNYCLSEISLENQEEYFKKLIINCDKKFYIWNYLTRKRKLFFFKTKDIEFLDKKDYIIEPERTLTGAYNEFIFSK